MEHDPYFEPVVIGGGDPAGDQTHRRRRTLYLTMTVALTIVMALAVTDCLGVTRAYGVHTSHVHAAGGGTELEVFYGTVSRPALATPFEITVRRVGGFTSPVTVSVLAEYLSIWDENGLDPQPTSEVATGDRLVWTFDPPPGEQLVISYDARIEPAAQQGKSGDVSVLDQKGSPIVSVSFATAVRP